MAEMSRSECINHLKRSRDILMLSSHVDNQRNEAFNKAISAMEKIEKIENELKMFRLADDTEDNFRQFHKQIEQILRG